MRLAEMEINKDRIKVKMQDRIQDRMKARSRDRGSQVNRVNKVVNNRAVGNRDNNKVSQQQGQQQGAQQGGQQSGGTQNGGQSFGARERGQRMSGAPQWGPIGDGWGDNRQIPAEVRERLREAQDLRREWGATSTGATRQLDEVIDRLKQLADGRMEGDAATAALLKQDVVEPLRQLELELSRQIQQQSGRTNLRLRDEGAAPETISKGC